MYLMWVISLNAVLNYIPVVTTIITTFVSLMLARGTLRQIDAADKGLELSREQFEREWSPELHIRLERISASDAKIIITNLGRTSVLLQLLQLRKISHAIPFERYFLNDPLVGGMTWVEHIGDRLLAVSGHDFEGTIATSVTFFASGRMFRSDWFRFNVQVCNGKFFRIEPITLPAHRVQVLETGHPGMFRLDLVRDVTADVAAVGKKMEDE